MTRVLKIPLRGEHMEGIMLNLSSGEDQFLLIDPHLISPYDLECPEVPDLVCSRHVPNQWSTT